MLWKEQLTTSEAGEWCGVSFRTVLRWIERGQLKAHKLPGRGDHRIAVDDFQDFLTRHELPVPNPIDRNSTRVLIVEDEEDGATLIGETLRIVGYETASTTEGFSAGARMISFRPDVITLDLHMPGLNGLQIIQFIRSMRQFLQTRILVISGLKESELRQARSLGADDVISKPIDLNLLKLKVAALALRKVKRASAPQFV